MVKFFINQFIFYFLTKQKKFITISKNKNENLYEHQSFHSRNTFKILSFFSWIFFNHANFFHVHFFQLYFFSFIYYDHLLHYLTYVSCLLQGNEKYVYAFSPCWYVGLIQAKYKSRWKHITMVHSRQENVLLFSTSCIILGAKFSPFHFMFWETLKMDFWHKSSHTNLVIFQMIMFFKKLLYIHTLMLVWLKNFIQLFFVKSHEWNSSYRIEWDNEVICNIWLNTKSKFNNCLNDFKNMFALCSISIQLQIFH